MKSHFTMIGIVVACLTIPGVAYGNDDHGKWGGLKFESNPSGAQEVVFEGGVFVPGGRDTDAEARIKVKFDKELSKVEVNLKIRDLVGNFAAAHFHCGRAGQNGPIPFGLQNPGPLEFDGRRIRGTLTNTDFNGADCVPVVGRPINNIAALAFAMRDGLIYINVHSTIFGPGEVRGQMLED